MIKFAENLKLLLKYKLRDWIPYDKLDLKWLSANININAIDILKVANPDNLDWKRLAENTSAYEILRDKIEEEKKLLPTQLAKLHYSEKIDWGNLSSNPNAIKLLRDKIEQENKLSPTQLAYLEYHEKIDWKLLSGNPGAIKLLKKNQEKINYQYLSMNPSIFALERWLTGSSPPPFTKNSSSSK
jgi:hypothetical protein